MTKPGEILYQISGDIMVPLKVLSVEEVVRQAPNGEDFSDRIVKLETPDGELVEDFQAAFFYVPFIPEIESQMVDKQSGARKAA